MKRSHSIQESPSTVQCPVCYAKVQESLINIHMDTTCLSSKPKPTAFKSPQNKKVASPFTPRSTSDPLILASPSSSLILKTSTASSISLGSTKQQQQQKEATSPSPQKQSPCKKPLPEQLRPTTFEEFLFSSKEQEEYIQFVTSQTPTPSLILYGPPGTGKTTLARLLGRRHVIFHEFSACLHTIQDMKPHFPSESKLFKSHPTVIFVDEFHRFSKAQQDIFLQGIEKGKLVLIAATTENPSFRINNAIVSRCYVIPLEPHKSEQILQLLQKALLLRKVEPESVTNEVLTGIAKKAGGDARKALLTLETVLQTPPEQRGRLLKQTIPSHSRYDSNGEEHYHLISAFHKSIRGSDDNATLYYLGRMLVGGEDPLYIARRMIRIASEDVGLGDPLALTQAVSAFQAAERLGMPECDVVLAQCAVYLSRAPKSVQVYQAYKNVKKFLADDSTHGEVPLHLRNPATPLMESLGYGKGYKYNPDYPDGAVEQQYLPNALAHIHFFPDASIKK